MYEVRWMIPGSFLGKGRCISAFAIYHDEMQICVDPKGAKRQKRKDSKAKHIQMKKEADGINQLHTQLGGNYHEHQT